MNDAQFFKSLHRQQAQEEATVKQAIERAPDACVVVYYVHYREYRMPFGTLLEAFQWAVEEQRAENCYVEKYLLADGTELVGCHGGINAFVETRA